LRFWQLLWQLAFLLGDFEGVRNLAVGDIILIDSHAREALQLEDGVKYKYRGITYTLKGIGQDKPAFLYTVRVYSRIRKAILIKK
jgi:hypothetical protein